MQLNPGKRILNCFLGYVLLVIAIVSFSCSPAKKEQYSLQEAWNENDTTYVINYINDLNKSVSDIVFFNRVAEASRVTNYYYGNIDATEERWKFLSKAEKEKRRSHISWIFKNYIHSELFFRKDLPGEISLEGQNKYFLNSYKNDPQEYARYITFIAEKYGKVKDSI